MASSINPSSLPQVGPGGSTPAGVARKPEESTEAHHDVVIISPPQKDTPQTVLNVRVPVDNRLLQPDPQTGDVPIEIVVVKKTPSLAGLDPAYVGDPIPEPSAPQGKVNVPAWIPIDQAEFDSGQYKDYRATVIKPDQEVVEKGAIERARDEALPPGMIPDVAPSGKGVRMPGVITRFTGMEQLSYGTLQSGLAGAADLGGMIAGFNLALSHGIGGSWAGYAGLAAGPMMMYNALGQLKNASDHQNYVHTVADRKGLSELPVAVNPATGKHIPTILSTPVKELDQNFDGAKRTAVGKLLQGGLITAAGVTALSGSPAAPFLALAGLGSTSVATAVNAKKGMEVLAVKEKELKAMLAEGKNTVLEEVPVYKFQSKDGQILVDRNGQPAREIVGSRKVEVPIQSKLDTIAEEKKKLLLSLPQSAAMVASPAIALLTNTPLMAAGMSVGAVSLGLTAAKEGVDTYHLHKKKVELENLREQGQTTIKQWLPQVDQTGTITGSKEVEVPIDDQIKALDRQVNSGAMKTAGFGAGAGALGAIGMGGVGLLTAATGALALPVGVYAYQQLSGVKELNDEKKDLLKLQAEGATTYKQQRVLTDAAGNIAGIQEVELPIADRLKEIKHDMKVGGMKATCALTAGGMAVAVAAGAPLVMVAAGLAIPVAAAFAIMNKETTDMLKHGGQAVWSGISGAGAWVGEKLSEIGHWLATQLKKLWPFGKDGDESQLSPATQELRGLHKELAQVDKKAANQLLSLSERLAITPDAEERKELQERYNEAFKTLADKDPELAGKWPQAVMALQREGMEMVARQQASKALAELEPQAETFRQSISDVDRAGLDKTLQSAPMQAVVNDPALKSMADSLGLTSEDVNGLARTVALANLKGNPVEIHTLNARAQAGDEQAQKLAQLLPALQQAATEQAPAGDPKVQAFLKSFTPAENEQVEQLIQGPLQTLIQAPAVTELASAMGLSSADVTETARMLVRLDVKKDPTEMQALLQKADAGDEGAKKLVQLAGALQQAARGPQEAPPPAASPAELEERITSVMAQDPILHSVLGSPAMADVSKQLGLSNSEVGDIARTWVRAQVRQDPSEINVLAGKAKQGDADSQKRMQAMGALEQLYGQAQQQLAQQGEATGAASAAG